MELQGKASGGLGVAVETTIYLHDDKIYKTLNLAARGLDPSSFLSNSLSLARFGFVEFICLIPLVLFNLYLLGCSQRGGGWLFLNSMTGR